MKRLRKKEALFISNKLAEVDLSIMAAFVTKEVDMTEHHVTWYPTRKALWQYVKNEGLEEVLQFLLSTFCQWYKECSTGGERYTRLLASWYQQTVTLACANSETQDTKTLWLRLTANYKEEISSLDRSALISAVTSCAFTFFRNRWGNHITYNLIVNISNYFWTGNNCHGEQSS